jgi:hypothetical protein
VESDKVFDNVPIFSTGSALQGFNVAGANFLGVQPNVSSEIATLAGSWNFVDLAELRRISLVAPHASEAA